MGRDKKALAGYWLPKRLLIALISLATLSIFFYKTSHLVGQTEFDDAFMVTRYAKNYLKGNGFSWNSIDGAAYGITSPLYLFIITGILKLTQVSDQMALTLTSYSFGLLSIPALIALGFLIQQTNNLKTSLSPWLVVPLISLSSAFTFHSLTGMETTLSLFLNSIFAISIWLTSQRAASWTLYFCLFCGLLTFIVRPDNGIYALFLPPLFIFVSNRVASKRSIFYLIYFSFLITITFLGGKLIFGDFMPLPFFAKRTGFYEGYLGGGQWNAMEYMLGFLRTSTPFLAISLLTISRKTFFQYFAIGITMMASFLYYASVTQIMGTNFRYYYPSLAFIIFGSFICVYSQSRYQWWHSIRKTMGIRMGLLGAIVCILFSGSIRGKLTTMWERNVIPHKTSASIPLHLSTPRNNRLLPTLGWWKSIQEVSQLLNQLPSETVFAASEYGYIGSRFPDMTIIDLVGLHDRHIAHHGFDGEYILSRKPDLIWLPTPNYSGSIYQILTRPEFLLLYVYFPNAYDYGIALRRASPLFSRIKKTFTREFFRVYGEDPKDFVLKDQSPF